MYVIFEMELETLYTSNFAIKEIKGRTIIPNKQNLERKRFGWVLIYASENQTENKTY